ncbi:hypothetical protein [Trichothermofontia sp.]
MRPYYLYAAIAALALTVAPGLTLVGNAQADIQPGLAQPGQRRSDAKPRMNFTEAQKQQFQAIRQRTREQINAVLTPEQRAQIASRQRGEPMNLNLTEQQRAQIQAIRAQSRQEMDALLTPEQRQIQNEMKQNWEQRRGNRGQGMWQGRGPGRGHGMGPGRGLGVGAPQ